MLTKISSSLIFILCLFLISCSSSDEETSPANASLKNTRWVLRTLNGLQVTTPPGGKEAFMTFTNSNNKVSGSGGCNNFFSTYTLRDNSLKIGPVASTEMFCQNAMETEGKFFKALEKVQGYKIKGDFLSLLDSTNSIVAKLEVVYMN